ncbi:MAG: polymerase sigma-70 factor, subfamily [Acidobacteriaceae bacterium]|jgi:RNA polymerase sigma-70 factor (ECF subfamily)|nr:polymerase sigma-70 factor, subfamily [Acidobacteriaceae bacterium]
MTGKPVEPIDVIRSKAGPSADEPLVFRARTGDVNAFECLVNMHGRQVYRMALRIVRRPEDAEDIVQETFVRAYRALPQFQGNCKFSTWLTRIAVNQALMTLRKRRGQRIALTTLDTDEGVLVLDPPDTRPNPEERCWRTEVEDSIGAALTNLPDTLRSAFILRHLHECTTVEIARELGISISAVKSRVLRARSLMKKRLATRLGYVVGMDQTGDTHQFMKKQR